MITQSIVTEYARGFALLEPDCGQKGAACLHNRKPCATGTMDCRYAVPFYYLIKKCMEKLSFQEQQRERARLENLKYKVQAELLIEGEKQKREKLSSNESLELILAQNLILYKELYKERGKYITALVIIIIILMGLLLDIYI